MDKIVAMRVFCQVIEAGSLVAAAERLGMSSSAVSRHLFALEKQLNARLLTRSTRALKATDDGFAYFERCTQLLADLDEADASVSGATPIPRGRLRITAPIAFAIGELSEAFKRFRQLYKEVILDLVVSDHLIDFADDGIDLAIRIGRLGSDNVVARLLADTSMALVAAPSYLQTHAVLQKPEDLTAHDCFLYSLEANSQQWLFQNARGEQRTVRLANATLVSNNGLLLAEMAACGSGLTYAPRFVLETYLKAGRLVEVIPEWCARRIPIHVVYPSRRHLSTKVRTMSDFLINWFATKKM